MATGVSELPDGPPDETGLTARQRAILEVIRETVERQGYPPSVREIGVGVGLTSPSSVAHQLGTLEKLGYLRRDPTRPRALVVAEPSAPAGLRLVDKDGKPRIMAETTADGAVVLPIKDMASPKK